MEGAIAVSHAMRNQALKLTQMGFNVFPLIAGAKQPAITDWQKLATKNVEIIDNWFTRKPPQNIGIATGNGLLVVDVDTKIGKNGLASLDEMQHTHAQLPTTLVARTATGGFHYYLSYDPLALELGNRANVLAGIDTRAKGGYVVAPGSIIAGRAYTWLHSHPIAKAPDWLLRLVGKREPGSIDRVSTKPAAPTLDDGPQILAASLWLSSAAPAIEGSGGDHTTFVAACRMKDFGLSQGAAYDLMAAIWNPRCQPPWTFDDLETKVANAYSYGENRQASATPEAHFPEDETVRLAREASKISDAQRKEEPFSRTRPKPVLEYAPAKLPPRRWVIGKLALEGKVTVLIAPGGVGKSTLTLLAGLAVATGRDDLFHAAIRPHTRPPAFDPFDVLNLESATAKYEMMRRAAAAAPAWIFNNEDDQDELQRRLFAMMKLHGIIIEDLMTRGGEPRLFLNSGEHRPFLAAKRVKVADGSALIPADAPAMTAHAKALGVKLIVVDPFIETHDADENSNPEIAQVARIYRMVAQKADCAVVLVHHTRKHPAASADSSVGDADSGRGAGALVNVARVARTLYSMSAADAKMAGVGEHERWKYVRLDNAKANLSAPTASGVSGAEWFERVGVSLETDGGPGAEEEVGALRYWSPGALVAGAEGAGEDMGVTAAERAARTEAAVAAVLAAGGWLGVRDCARTIGGGAGLAGISEDSLRKFVERRFKDGVGLADGRVCRIALRGGVKTRHQNYLEIVASTLF